MKRLLIIVSFILGFIFSLELIFLLVIRPTGFNFSLKDKTDLSQQTSLISPTPAFSENPSKIVYQQEGDAQGRSVVYINQPGKALNDSGKIYGQSGDLYIVIGQVDSFEPINNSQDEYIVLTDPDTKETLIKGRINYTSQSNPTELRVENLSNSNKQGISVEKLDRVNLLGQNIVHRIIKKGDVVAVLLASGDNSWENIFDENQNPYLTRIIVRRFGGKSSINQELNLSL